MWLVDRLSNDCQRGRIPIPMALKSALVRWYIGEGSRADEEAGLLLVQQARIGHKWLACDCLGTEARPPILTPAFLSDAETFYLRRLTSHDRPDHRTDCPFFRDQATARISESRERKPAAQPPGGFFEVLRPAPEKLAQRPDAHIVDDRTRHASLPKLALLTRRLLGAAARNICPPPGMRSANLSIKAEFGAILSAAGRIEVAPGIELGRVLWTHASALQSRRAYAALRALEPSWPVSHAPQGFLALFAQEFHGQLIHIPGGGTIRIANRIQSPSIRGHDVIGPHLVLVVFGEYPQARGYAPLRAYAQPIFSGHRFVPIDSNEERDLLRGLLTAQFEFARHRIALMIEKPVFQILTPVGECRPDFILEATNIITGESRRLVVMAGGEPDVAAIGAQHYEISALSKIAPVLIARPGDIARTQWLEHLFDCLGAKIAR